MGKKAHIQTNACPCSGWVDKIWTYYIYVFFKALYSPYLGVDTNDLATLVTVVCEHIFIALYAEGIVVSQDIPEENDDTEAVGENEDESYLCPAKLSSQW